MASTIGNSDRPRSVSEYSTFGGVSAGTPHEGQAHLPAALSTYYSVLSVL